MCMIILIALSIVHEFKSRSMPTCAVVIEFLKCCCSEAELNDAKASILLEY